MKSVLVYLKSLNCLRPYSIRVLTICALTILSIPLAVSLPYFAKLIVDRAIASRQLESFIFFGLLAAGTFIANGIIKAASSYLEKELLLRVGFDLRKEIFSRLQGLPLNFFRDRSTGEHIFKIDHDVRAVTDLVVSIPRELIGSLPKAIFVLAIIFHLDWQLAVIAFLFAPVLYIPAYFIFKKMRMFWRQYINNSQDIFKRLEEVFSHIYLVKALGRERDETEDFLKMIAENTKLNLRNVKLEVIGSFASTSLTRIITGAIALFGGYQVIRGESSVGTLTAIMMYLGELYGLQNIFLYLFRDIALGLVSLMRLNDILELGNQSSFSTSGRALTISRGLIDFKGVTFGYDPKKAIVRDLDFSLKNGFIGLIGKSGCGKTTILNLILGLYEPWEGAISIDGYNLREFDPVCLKSKIGVSLQEPFLWNDTVANNIRYAKEEATLFEVSEAARLVGADEFIKELPKGYETIIGENACKISEGQKQRLALARALIRQPKILIFDEAMSSMDSESEEKILSDIRKYYPQVTVLVVSHRLSTVKQLDIIYFLKNNSQIVVGSAKELLRDEPDFAALFASQGA